jgi:hypothetical protein
LCAAPWGVARWHTGRRIAGRGSRRAWARSSQASHAPASCSRVRRVLQQRGLFRGGDKHRSLCLVRVPPTHAVPRTPHTHTARAHARRGAAPAVASACTSRRHAERRRRRRGHRRVGCAAACCLVNETQQPGGCTSAARRTSVLACVPGGRRIRHGGGRSRASAARRVARWVCRRRQAESAMQG